MRYLYFKEDGTLFINSKSSLENGLIELIVQDDVETSRKQKVEINDSEIEIDVDLDYNTILNSNSYKLSNAKQYLIDTDYKVLPDYDGDTIGIIEARAEARTLIRSLEAK